MKSHHTITETFGTSEKGKKKCGKSSKIIGTLEVGRFYACRETV